MPRHSFPAAVLLIPLLAAAANAQWTFTSLHPAGAKSSVCTSIADGQQGGYAYFGDDKSHAGIWAGSAGSWIDLHPVGVEDSRIEAIGDGQQVGRLFSTSGSAVWNGTPESFVELTPQSRVTSVSGGKQAGSIRISTTVYHACYWTGTPESVVDIHPSWAQHSSINDINNDQLCGQVNNRAAYWQSTSASVIDLHPSNAVTVFPTTRSEANATHGGQQVGYVQDNIGDRAALWSGTPESYVDLGFDSARESIATDIHNGFASGLIYHLFDYNISPIHCRAVVWTGTKESWEDLSTALPTDYGRSLATGVWTDDTTVYVVGMAYNKTLSRNEAALWTRPIASCKTDCQPDTVLDLFDILCFLNHFQNNNRTIADCNVDLALDIHDILCYLNRFDEGCN